MPGSPPLVYDMSSHRYSIPAAAVPQQDWCSLAPFHHVLESLALPLITNRSSAFAPGASPSRSLHRVPVSVGR